MKKTDKALLILWAVTACLYFVKYITIPIYKHILAKPEIVKPMPERSVMIKKARSARRHYGDAIDTIYTQSTNDTIYLYPNIPQGKSGVLEILVQVDSISGATNGRIVYESSGTGLLWNSAYYNRHDINGSTPQEFGFSESIYKYLRNDSIRIRIIGGYSTQLTKVRFRSKFVGR